MRSVLGIGFSRNRHGGVDVLALDQSAQLNGDRDIVRRVPKETRKRCIVVEGQVFDSTGASDGCGRRVLRRADTEHGEPAVGPESVPLVTKDLSNTLDCGVEVGRAEVLQPG